MTRIKILALLLFIYGGTVTADYLIVSRKATIKDAPERKATIVDRSVKGDSLQLLDSGVQQNGYYHVSKPRTNITGWIYRTLVRRYEGNLTVSLALEDVKVTVIDVGAGLSCLIELPNNKFMVYDVGRASAMELISTRIPAGGQIEWLILSHTDADHWGAAEFLVSEYEVKNLLWTDYRASDYSQTYLRGAAAIGAITYQVNNLNLGANNVTIDPGTLLYDEGGAKLYFMCGFAEPLTEWGNMGNSHKNNGVSIVVKLEYAGQSILFCGDAVGKHDCDATGHCIATEDFMIQNLSTDLLDCDVMIAPHHGADNSSCTGFIESVSPEYVVFSAGHAYRHPRLVTAERYLTYGVDIENIFRTDKGDHETYTGDDCKLEWDYLRVMNWSDKKRDDNVEIVLSGAGNTSLSYFEQ